MAKAATEKRRQIVDRVKKAHRVIELARAWQNSERWTDSFRASHWNEFRQQGSAEVRKAERVRLTYPGEVEGHEKRAKDYFEQAEHAREFLVKAKEELRELANLLRECKPELLPLVPHVDFSKSPPDDWSDFLNAMRKIESAFRVIEDEGIERFDKLAEVESSQQSPPATMNSALFVSQTHGMPKRYYPSEDLPTDPAARKKEIAKRDRLNRKVAQFFVMPDCNDRPFNSAVSEYLGHFQNTPHERGVFDTYYDCVDPPGIDAATQTEIEVEVQHLGLSVPEYNCRDALKQIRLYLKRHGIDDPFAPTEAKTTSKRTKLTQQTDGPLKPDGPISPDGFRFNGREINGLAPDWLTVLTFVWERRAKPPTLSDVITHVHAKDRIEFDKLLDRIRKKLKGKKWPETLEVFNGCLLLRVPVRQRKATSNTKRVKKTPTKAGRSVPAKSAKSLAPKSEKMVTKRRETRGGKK